MKNKVSEASERAFPILILIATVAALLSLAFFDYIETYAQSETPAELDAPVLAASSSGSNSVDLSWSSVNGAARYELWGWWDSEAGWQQLDDGELTGTTFSHSELDAGTTYFYLVRAVSGREEAGAWSERVSATVEGPEATLAPPILAAAAVEGAVELSWTPVSGAASYELWTWTSWEGWQRLDDGNLAATTYSHSGLLEGMTYYYGIRALDGRGMASEWGQQVSAKVPGFLAVPEVPEERAALVALYESTDGANWRRRDHWLSDVSIANWFGVFTDQQGHVTGVYLDNNGLSGTIPDLSALTSLVSLDLGINRLSGPVPDLSHHPVLATLSLQDNQLTGSVPELNSLVDLRDLYLNDNQLTGPIPDLSGLTGLTALNLSENRLTGRIPSLSALTELQTLDLGSNQLTGPVPELCPLAGLTSVYLGSNQLTGRIPELCDLPQLKVLFLSNNRLTGPIPDLSALTSLEVLYLGNNGLAGPIPDLSALTNLWRVSLGSNRLTGSVPELEGLTNLTQLFLENNRLTGSIPDLGKIPKLTDLNLSGNSLEGPIPELGALTRLTNLKLNSNLLTGTAPALRGLSFLKELDFSDNGLTGGIPDLSGLFRLEALDLSENRLSGPIPDLSDLTRLVGVSMGDNRLTGSVPDLSALANLRWLSLKANRLTGQIPDLSLFSNLRMLDLSDNLLTGPVVDLDALGNLTRLALSHNLLTGPLPDFAGLPNLIFLELTGNQFCLAPGSGGSGSSVFVNVHLETLSPATCRAADLALAPAVPSNLQATISDGKVTLEWDAAANADSYDLRVWDSIDRRWGPLGDQLSVTQFSHSALTDGRNYYYQVRARDANGVRSAWSERLFAAVVQQQFRPPPLSLEFDLFYQKYLDVDGVAVAAPTEVADEKMIQAREIITGVLADRPDLLETLAANDARIEFYGYWEEAAGSSDAWEAEVTQHDPNCGHFLQEFAHLIRRAVEEQPGGEEFRLRLENVYQAAVEEGLWRGGPASKGAEGYWAETVKYWFWEAGPESITKDSSELADYDPEAALLVEEVFGEADVPSYCKPQAAPSRRHTAS